MDKRKEWGGNKGARIGGEKKRQRTEAKKAKEKIFSPTD